MTTDEATLPTDVEPVIRIIPMPQDTNPNGDIFGGWLMSHVDLAGSVVAVQRIRGRMATVSLEVFAEWRMIGDFTREVVKVTEAEFSYVALDENRRPCAIPPLKE